jgi:hypothetical protein
LLLEKVHSQEQIGSGNTYALNPLIQERDLFMKQLKTLVGINKKNLLQLTFSSHFSTF